MGMSFKGRSPPAGTAALPSAPAGRYVQSAAPQAGHRGRGRGGVPSYPCSTFLSLSVSVVGLLWIILFLFFLSVCFLFFFFFPPPFSLCVCVCGPQVLPSVVRPPPPPPPSSPPPLPPRRRPMRARGGCWATARPSRPRTLTLRKSLSLIHS